MPFANNVFVNCPFDDDYRPLLQALLFTVVYLKFVPRIGLESIDSGKPRIDKILKLIRESKYAVHDLSRFQAKKKGEFFRLNMPFELGLDSGCRQFKGGKWRNKACLILVTQRYKHQAAISDIAGSDTQEHGNRPVELVRQVRNWLNSHTRSTFHGGERIWIAFNVFRSEMYESMRMEGEVDGDIDGMPVDELIRRMQKWVRQNLP